MRRPGTSHGLAVVAFAFAFALAIGFGHAAIAQTSLAKIRIGTAKSDLGGQVFYAQDLGFFKSAGLDAEISPISGGPTIMAAVASGDLDVGWGNAIDVSVAHQHGIPITIIATGSIEDQSDPGTGLLVASQASGIHAARDLNGKTIALLSLHNFAEMAARLWLDKNGGDSKSVHFVELPYSAMADAVKAGRVDAAVMDNTADPTLGKPGDVLHLMAPVFFAVAPRLEGVAWYSTTTWVAKHQDEVRRFVAVMKQTGDWANAHHQESAQILAAHIGRTVDQITGGKRVVYSSELTPALIQPELDVALKYGLLTAPVPARDIISIVPPQ